MDLQTFLQWFFIVASGASILGAWLAWASRKNGRETRKFLGELLNKMDERAERTHREVLSKFLEQDVKAETRHQEVIELLKKGFSEVLQTRA